MNEEEGFRSIYPANWNPSQEEIALCLGLEGIECFGEEEDEEKGKFKRRGNIVLFSYFVLKYFCYLLAVATNHLGNKVNVVDLRGRRNRQEK